MAEEDSTLSKGLTRKNLLGFKVTNILAQKKTPNCKSCNIVLDQSRKETSSKVEFIE